MVAVGELVGELVGVDVCETVGLPVTNWAFCSFACGAGIRNINREYLKSVMDPNIVWQGVDTYNWYVMCCQINPVWQALNVT